jgi:hypothetical protein
MIRTGLNTILLTVLSVAIITSCTYDSREEVESLMTCDTTNVTLSLTIWPILSNNCIVCHSGAAPAGGLDYENYNDLLSVANDGRLVGAINHLDGFEPMPRFAPKLPACDIMKIEKWVNDGALNN